MTLSKIRNDFGTIPEWLFKMILQLAVLLACHRYFTYS